jgi:drug/metabolite transporter (DMT)-like permease
MKSAPADDPAHRFGGLAAAVGAMVGWGLGPVFVKYIELPGLVLSFHRLWIGALVGLAILTARGERLSLSKIWIATPGGVAFALDIALFFVAVKHTTVANATVISALQPVLVFIVVGRLFGERVTIGDLAWTAVAIAGVAIVVFGAGDVAGGSVTGDVLAVGALLAWTWYFVASKRARQRLTALEYQAALGVVAFVVIAPMPLLNGDSLAVSNASTWGWILFMVALPGSGHYLMNWAHEYVPLTVTSLLTLTTPVIAAIGAALVLDEPLLLVQALGMALVLVSLGIVVRRRGRATREPAVVPVDDPAVLS